MAHDTTGVFNAFLNQGEVIDAIIGLDYKEHPWVYDQVFNIKSSSKSREHIRHYAGLGYLGQYGEGQTPTLDEAIAGYEHWLTHVQWGLGFQVTEMMLDDDQYDRVRRLTEELAFSGRHTVETVAAYVLINGLTTNGYDGVPLFSDSHPLENGSTGSNVASTDADLSQIALEDAYAKASWVLDGRGKPVGTPPTHLIVSPNDAIVASKLVKSAFEPETGNNAINPLKGKLSVIVWPQLFISETGFDDWFLINKSRQDLRFYWRKQLKPDSVFDGHSRSMTHYLRGRFCCGYADWRYTYGVSGAA